ncbi:ABC transporter ATP-binding protein [Larkinella sp. VNQ87]|uniref:ABC transporter ATP-binding protein n=1 Tax=Larkinella sp. VNQ87 TaxID=3400921 RepID=UPI003C0AC00A
MVQRQTPQPVVQLIGVSKSYGCVPAVQALDVTIFEGEIVALIGLNGSGKTTALALMAGLLRPTQGQVRLFDQEASASQNRRRVGLMPHTRAVPESLQVDEWIDFCSQRYDDPLPPSFVADVADLSDFQSAPLATLSNGQRRRLAFGLALCGIPDLLLLDEPATGLDAVGRTVLAQQIRHFAQTGRTVVLTTHDLTEAEALANRILVLHHGCLLADATPAQLRQQAGGSRIRCRTSLDLDWLRQLPSVTDVCREEAFVYIHTPTPESVLRLLFQYDEQLSDLAVSRGGLDDAVRQLIHTTSVVI